MPLSRITVENYKCFGQSQAMEIAPITILLGKNNAGKSAIARTPLLLSSGVVTSSPEPLDTAALGSDGGSFEELIHGRSPHGSIKFELAFVDSERGNSHLAVTIQNVDELQMQVVSELTFVRDDSTHVRLVWDYSSLQEVVRRYEVIVDGQSLGAWPIGFNGIVPNDVPVELPQDSAQLPVLYQPLHALRNGFDEIRYLGPFREQPRRFYQMPSRSPSEIGSMGEFAPSTLAMDARRTSGRLLESVNSLLDAGLPGWALDVEGNGTAFSIVLAPAWDPAQRINLVDTGTGIAQVLPIFIQRALDIASAGQERARPMLEIVEQPELHLHPSAHANLADLYINAALSGASRFIVETHSETFLLRLRRRIAEGAVSPDAVRVYFADNSEGATRLQLISIDQKGNMDYWPEGVFSEDYQETRALADAQIKRLDSGAHHN